MQNDYQLLYDILNDIWWPAIKPLINSTDRFIGTIAYQPLTEGMIANFAKNGGNALGVNGSQGPLISESPFFRATGKKCAIEFDTPANVPFF